MEEVMRDVCADFGAELAEFNGMIWHIDGGRPAAGPR
jgi:thermostable 8-oxoguanine DNA glycosylase